MENATTRVLLVEDDKVDQMVFERLVKNGSLPYNSVVAGSVLEAQKILESETFDVVLTDYLLRDGTAFDVCDLALDTPIIVTTGAGDEEIAVEVMKAGATDYLVKSKMSAESLSKSIHYAMELHKKEEQRRQAELALRNAKDELEIRVKERTAELSKSNELLKQEIAERKRAEEKLQEVYVKNAQLLASISSILIGTDSDGQVSQWNSAAEKTFGPTSADVVGRPLIECDIQWDWDEVVKKMNECERKAQPIPLNDLRYTRPDGKDGFLNLTLNPIKDSKNKRGGCLLLGEEITERKNLESQLALAQKMESIGHLATGIAHEINTPMQYISDNTRFYQEAFEDLKDLLDKYDRLRMNNSKSSGRSKIIEDIVAFAEEIDVEYLLGEIPNAVRQTQEGIDRVTKIVSAMKTFSHPGAVEKTAIDINKAIESTLTVSTNEWKYVAEIVKELDHDLPAVLCLPGEFNQVILNIIINAAHAIAEVLGGRHEKKGTITVRTKRDLDWVEIRISDTGCGIPEEIRDRIFDPFFTTKEVGKGTGQGLAIAHSIVVEKHGGEIYFETVIGRGTTFTIRLPLNPETEFSEEAYETADTLC